MIDKRFSIIEDPANVLERMGGSEALFERLLLKFRDSYQDSRLRLSLLLETHQNDEAWRLVHSIKGVSANLGLGKLYRLTLALETRMKANEYESMQKETDAFLEELDMVVTVLGEVTESGSPGKTGSA